MSETRTMTTRQQVWKREEQWVARVVGFSSQYNDSTWSANQVIGAPRVYPRHGDLTGAWAQGNRANNEFIIVEYDHAVHPEQIEIYETYNPGAVMRVSARNGNDAEWITVWETDRPHVEAQSRIFSVPFQNQVPHEIDQIRLDIDCSAASNWCEIDCIKLVGHLSHNRLSHKELTANLKQLLTDDCLSDVTFKLDDQRTISSYRNILKKRSFYFDELFKEYPSENKQPIPIPNISYDAFYQILHYAFTSTIEPALNTDTCLELMRKADGFFLSPIYDCALSILKKSINKANVLQLYVASGMFSTSSDANGVDDLLLEDIVNLCVEFTKNNRRDVLMSEQMKDLTKDMILTLVQLSL